MPSQIDATAFVQAVRAEMDRAARLLGDAWPSFGDRLNLLLDKIIDTDESDRQALIATVLRLGLNSPAAPVFQEIERQYSTKITKRVWGDDLATPYMDVQDTVNLLTQVGVTPSNIIQRNDGAATRSNVLVAFGEVDQKENNATNPEAKREHEQS